MNYSYKSFKKLLDKEIKEAKDIVITSHLSPDDDSVSSVLAMYSYIKKKFPDKKVKAVYEEMDPNFLRFGYFKYFDEILFMPNLMDQVDESALIIVLDVSTILRCTNKLEDVSKIPNKIIAIDHHKNPKGVEVAYYFNKTETSTAETLFKMILPNPDPKTAEILLLGMLGDTGYFSYLGKGQVNTANIIFKLVDIADLDTIESFKQKYWKNTLEDLEVLGLFLSRVESIKVDNWPAIYFTYIDQKDSAKYSNKAIKSGYAMAHFHFKNVLEFDSGLILKYRNGKYEFSFRSNIGGVNVRVLAEGFVNGGGHDASAGGSIDAENGEITIEDVKKSFIGYLKTHNPVYI